MKTYLGLTVTCMILAGLHWVLVFAMCGVVALGQLPTEPGGNIPPATVDAARKFDRMFNGLFKVLTWPGRLLQPTPSFARGRPYSPSFYKPLDVFAVATSFAWGFSFTAIGAYFFYVRREPSADTPEPCTRN